MDRANDAARPPTRNPPCVMRRASFILHRIYRAGTVSRKRADVTTGAEPG